MFQNYVTTALRNILKHKLYSLIKILGLAIGLMSCILILLFVKDEISYDSWLPDSENIVRLHSGFYFPGRPPFETVASAGRLAPTIQEFASDLVDMNARMVFTNPTVSKEDKIFNETIVFADPDFLNIFQFPFVSGEKDTAFAGVGSLVLTEEMAIKYFGRTDILGETLTVCCVASDPTEMQVTGVLKDLPENTHMDFDFLTRMDPTVFANSPNILDTWTSVNTYSYFKLKPGATPEQLQERISNWVDTDSPFIQMMAQGMPDLEGKPSDFIMQKIMPLENLHLYARNDAGNMGDLSPMGDITMVYAFTGIAILILIIASINFMNLSTARASQRAREVALRKVLGAKRSQVAYQLLGEAVIISLISLVIAFVGVELALPYYGDAVGKDLEMNLTGNGGMTSILVLMTIFVGIISGSYPALFLSGFLPAQILKANQSSTGGGSGTLRSALVIFQFAISIGLMIATAVVYGQTTFARSMDPGFSKADKLVLYGLQRDAMASQQDALNQQLKNIPGVKSVSFSSEVPTEDRENNTGFTLKTSEGQDSGQAQATIINYHSIDPEFLPTYDITPIAGRNFDEARGTDIITPFTQEQRDAGEVGNASILINEMAARALGFSNTEEAVGNVLNAGVFGAGNFDLTIIGVIPDIYFRSLKFGVRPSVYFYFPGSFRRATVEFETTQAQDVISRVETVWKELAPTTPLSHQHLIDLIDGQYAKEDSEAKLFASFSLLAVLVASLGLYGLASFTAERRTKEIGIRKVMGARVFDIIRLLVWQYSKYVLIANIIAWPIAGYFMYDWLLGFQYRIEAYILPILFVIAGVTALMIAWGTVGSHAAKVARANPIKALRYE